MKLKRYEGKVQFISVDDSKCYGEFPFDFYIRPAGHTLATLASGAEAKAIDLSDESVYADPRVDHIRQVEFNSVTDVDTVEVVVDVVVRVAMQVPLNDESPEEIAQEFIDEADCTFEDTTGKVFLVNTEISEINAITINVGE